MAAQRAGASRRTGLSPSGDPLRLGERSMPVSKALGTVARAWAREAGGRATRPSWKTIGAGPAARLLRAGRPARAEARLPMGGTSHMGGFQPFGDRECNGKNAQIADIVRSGETSRGNRNRGLLRGYSCRMRMLRPGVGSCNLRSASHGILQLSA
jgi:hypothetical protein